MKAWLTYDGRKGAHYVVRVVPKSFVENDSFSCTCDQLNNLLIVKTQAQLLDALADLPPLLPMESYDTDRICTIRRAIESFPKRFSSCNQRNLQLEFYLDSLTPLRANELSLDKLMKDYGRDGYELSLQLLGLDPDEYYVLSEPLGDWIAIRNLASISMRLLGYLEADEENPLTKAGFDEHYIPALKKTVLSVPFIGDPHYAQCEMDAAEALLEMTGSVTIVPPLYAMLTVPRMPSEGFEALIPMHKSKDFYLDYLSEKDDFFFSIEPEIVGSTWKQLKRIREWANDETMHLCAIKGKETNQRELARTLLHTINNAFKRLSYDPKHVRRNDIHQKAKPGIPGHKKDKRLFAPKENLIGWHYDEDAELFGYAQPKFNFLSFASALWYTLLFHEGKRITICAFCGNAALSSERGTPKEYCTRSCSTRASEQRKQEESPND